MAPEVAVDKKTMIKVVTKDFRKGVLKQHLEQLKIKYRKLEGKKYKNDYSRDSSFQVSLGQMECSYSK